MHTGDGQLDVESPEARRRHLQRREANPEGHPEVQVAERHRNLAETPAGRRRQDTQVQVSSVQIRLKVEGAQRRPEGPILGVGVVGPGGAGQRAGEGPKERQERSG